MTINDATAAACDVPGICSMAKRGKWRSIIVLVCGIIVGIWAALPLAQAAFPERPIRLLVPTSPGTGSDALMRIIAEKLRPILGQPVVVDDRPGANGVIAQGLMVNAKPDGYTIIYGSQGTTTANKCMYSDYPYDPTKDFAPIGLLWQAYPAFYVTAKLPIRTVTEFMAYAKAHPGLKFGHTGTGQLPHLPPTILANKFGLNLIPVAYTNNNQLFTDLTNGDVSLMFNIANAVQPLVEAGKVTPLATTGPKRLPILPNVPTMMEAGVNFTFGSFTGMFATPGTPRDVLQVLYNGFEKAMNDPAVVGFLAKQGSVVSLLPPDEFAKFMRTELDSMCKVMEGAGVVPRKLGEGG